MSILFAVAVATASLPVAAAQTHGAPESAPAEIVAPQPAPADPGPSIAEPGPPIAEPEGPPAEPEPPADKPEPVARPAATAKPAAAPAPAPPPSDDQDDELPERLSPMQTAGWWTLFGGVALGTLAGVMAGLAERQEDRALRLSVRFELDTGAQTRFEDVQSEYDATLRKGRAQAGAGVALAVIGLAAAIAGISVLAVAGAAERKAARARPSARVQWHGARMQVRF